MVRGVFLCLALTGICWSLVTLPAFWREFPVEQITRRTIRGEIFTAEQLEGRLKALADSARPTTCNASSAHNVAVLRLAILRQAFADPAVPLDEQLKQSRQAIADGLSCLPSDAYLWFALFQIESLRSGLKDEYVRYLEMSYQLGQNEGWIAIFRNKAAFAVFPLLNAELKTKVLDEFCGLVEAGLYGDALDIFVGAALPYREALLDRLNRVSLKNREVFAGVLAQMGHDVALPGVPVKTPRRI